MKQIMVAGNWKSNKTVEEGKKWIEEFRVLSSKFKVTENVKIILCVPFTLLFPLKELITTYKLPLELGAQDVSPYGEGAYTGEVNGKQIKELAEWVIIGHSERRQHFGETDTVLREKVNQAKISQLKIIYCVPDAKTMVPKTVDIVAYEPVWAIGTGKTDTPENANAITETIKNQTNVTDVIYGGSIKPDNVSSFVSQPAIDGVLPGGASLSAASFSQLIVHATNT